MFINLLKKKKIACIVLFVPGRLVLSVKIYIYIYIIKSS